jgi:hypothetical protein
MIHEFEPTLSRKEKQDAEKYGGFDLQDWIIQTETIGADKYDHRERSIAHQKNHLNHWKKIERGE